MAVLEVGKLRRDAADNHRKLLAAALAEFNDRGLDASVEQIAARAGVGIGTFYRRFGTKDALVAHLVDDFVAERLEAGRQLVAAGTGDGLELFVRGLATSLAAHRGLTAPLWSGSASDHAGQLRPQMHALLTLAKKQGTIRPEVTGNDVSVLMWSLRSIVEISGEAADAACQRHLDFALAGMRHGAAALPHHPLSERARLRALH